MHRWSCLLAAMAFALAGCSTDDAAEPGAEPSPEVSFPVATVLLDNGEESTLLTVDVAETPKQQSRALQSRDSLPEDEGIVFVFFEPRTDGFSTEDVPVPLSVAFFDADGTIVRILDADPCTNERCTSYRPGEEYMGVLHVDQGAFGRWDVSEGDHVQLTR